MTDPVLLDLPRPQRTPEGLEGEIIHIDHFGNLASNITVEDLHAVPSGPRGIEVRLGSARIDGLVKTFGDRRPGDIVALLGSTGNLIVAVVNGSASARLGLGVGAPVLVVLSKLMNEPGAGPS